MPKVLLLYVLLSFFVFTLVLPAMAQYATGVKSGDWMKYAFDISYRGMSYKGTIKITIHSVTSTYIGGTIEFTDYFPGSSPGSYSFSIYIPTWTSSDFINVNVFLIPSHLVVGQVIPGLYPTTTVQAIVDWQGRKAVKAVDPISQSEGYWDQATGVLLESKVAGNGMTGSIKAIDTNMFSLGLGWTLWIIIIVVAVIFVVAVAVVMLRRKKPPIMPPPLPTTSVPPPPPPPEEHKKIGYERKTIQGLIEIMIGFILLMVFYATLTIESIPFIWTGAAITGVLFILHGLYDILKG